MYPYRSMRARVCATLVALFGLTPMVAPTQQAASLTVSQAWARATPPGARVGGAYFTIVNGGPADTLMRLETPVAAKSEMHVTTMEHGTMSMRELQAVPVPAQGQVQFRPGGMHAMLLDLKGPLKEGQHFPLTLVFQHAGAVTVDVTVKGLGGDE